MRRSTYAQRTKMWKSVVRRVDNLVPGFQRALVKFFARQGRVVVRNFLEQSRMIGTEIHKGDLVVQGQLFDMDHWVAELKKVGKPWIEESVLQAMRELVEDPDLQSPAVRAALGNRLERFSQFTNQTTARKLTRLIRDGHRAGLSIEEIAAQIKRQIFDSSITTRRARNIARTEIMGANNFGTQYGMKQGGFQRKMWLTSRDDKVRESHRIDGQVRKVDENFTLRDGQQMMYPMDYNERCTHFPTQEPRTPSEQTSRQRNELGPEFERDTGILQKLEHDEIRHAEELGGGINKTMVLSDGVRGVFKPVSGESHSAMKEVSMKHEVAAYRIDRVFKFDLTPPTVIRRYSGEPGSYQFFVDNYQTAHVSKYVEKVSAVDREKLTLFDWLIENADRHGGNLMINARGKIAAIDNGYSFTFTGINTFFSESGIPLQEMRFKRWFKENFTFKAIKRVKETVFDDGLLTEREFKGFLGRVWQVLDEEIIPLDYNFGTHYFDDKTVEEALAELEKKFKKFKL